MILFATLLAPSALAAPKDGAADELYTQAMDEDYLNTDFDAAIKKLEKGVSTCGKSGCSPAVLSKLYVGLGVVHGGGKNDNATAKKYFVEAFKVDPNAKSLPDFMTPELNKLFEQAKQEVPAGDDDDDDDDTSGDDDDDDDQPAPGGDLDYEPPAEALVNHPLPIFVKVPDDVEAADVTLRYKPFGGAKWLRVAMRKKGDGWAGMIPCTEITTTGDLKLFILIKDKAGDAMAQAGTRNRPLVIKIKNDIDGKQPSLPGEKPPEKCLTSADCPPDFPGCKPTEKPGGGEKGWGASCEESDECRSGLVCLNGVCEQGEGDDDDDDSGPTGEIAKNIFYLGAQLDMLLIGGEENVCGTADSATTGYSQPLDNYFCFNGQGEFLGKPAEGQFNQIQGGLGVAGARILVGYDRILWEGLTVGARVGFAFGGSPSTGDAESRFGECQDAAGDGITGPDGDVLEDDECHQNLASDFLPVHLEIRAAYFFPDPSGFAGGLVRPYGFIGGGLAQVNAGVTVAVCDYVEDDGFTPIVDSDGDGRCPANTEQRDDIEAYQITGLNFVDFGAGANIAFHPMFGVNVEAKVMLMVPTFGVVIAPSISPVFMF